MHRFQLPTLLAVALSGVVTTTPARSQVADHLKCFNVSDQRAQTNLRYTLDLTPGVAGLSVEHGCTVQSTARTLCVGVAKSDVSPVPFPTSPGLPAQALVCYRMRCPRDVNITFPLADQLGGSGPVLVKERTRKRDLCVPANPSPTTTTTIPPSCGSSFPECGGSCPDGGVCGPDLSVGSCVCISPNSPCGDTSPVCNGMCPTGEHCAGFGNDPIFRSCGCIPDGATPCGSPGVPVCGGSCPADLECNPAFQLPIFGGGQVCACTTGAPCGQGGGGECPNGFGCGVIPPGPASCFPLVCTGDDPFPTCGGGCGDGGECLPITIGTFDGCSCMVP
jgi:hypothetical protein